MGFNDASFKSAPVHQKKVNSRLDVDFTSQQEGFAIFVSSTNFESKDKIQNIIPFMDRYNSILLL